MRDRRPYRVHDAAIPSILILDFPLSSLIFPADRIHNEPACTGDCFQRNDQPVLASIYFSGHVPSVLTDFYGHDKNTAPRVSYTDGPGSGCAITAPTAFTNAAIPSIFRLDFSLSSLMLPAASLRTTALLACQRRIGRPPWRILRPRMSSWSVFVGSETER